MSYRANREKKTPTKTIQLASTARTVIHTRRVSHNLLGGGKIHFCCCTHGVKLQWSSRSATRLKHLNIFL